MIIQHPNKILRRKSADVPLEEITKSKIKNIIREMKQALILSADKGGVALAAPQIGHNLRIFIILEGLLKIGGREVISENRKVPVFVNPAYRQDRVAASKPAGKYEDKPNFLVFINPKIVKKSQKKQTLQEGCLSVDGVQGKVKRPEKLTVKAFDENGKEFKMPATKFMSEAIEHEIDHLDGVLFIDKKIKM